MSVHMSYSLCRYTYSPHDAHPISTLRHGNLLNDGGDPLGEMPLSEKQGRRREIGFLGGGGGQQRREIIIAVLREENGFAVDGDRKSTRLNSSHLVSSYDLLCFKYK